MNVHHLELFYFVAKYEGITEAVRKMPYGIQQPAVSGQILQLERFLGVKLFHRRPFALTPSGDELYDFIYPFFSRLDQMTERLRGEESHHLRLAASAATLTHHLPFVLQALRQEYPTLRLTLRETPDRDLESVLRKREADLAIAIVRKNLIPGIKSSKLIDLPLAVFAPKNSDVETFRDLVRKAEGGQICEPLIQLPKHEAVAKLFQKGLTSKGLRWETAMEVSDTTLILKYVENGFGYGATVDIPGVTWPESVRKIRVPADFPSLKIGILHFGDLKPVAERFIELTREHAGLLKKQLREVPKKRPNKKKA
ncbi:MAG: LysR family transcriptional regulator [Verrucomicrobiota bacterium]